MISVDTNIIVHLFISGDQSEQAAALAAKDPDWRAPLLWKSEFRSVLALYLRQGLLTREDAGFIMQEAEHFMAGGSHHMSSTDVLELIGNCTLSAYDCEFVALAQQLACKLVTEDKKIVREFPQVAVSLSQALASGSAT